MTVSSINNCTPRKCKKPVRPHHDHTQLFCIQTAWWQVLIAVPNNLYRRIAAKSKRRFFAISCNRIFPKLMTKESAQIFASEICLACWAASVGQKRRPFDSRPVDWWSYRLEEDVTGHIHGVDFLSWSSWLILVDSWVWTCEGHEMLWACRSLLPRIFCIVPHGVIPLGILA